MVITVFQLVMFKELSLDCHCTYCVFITLKFSVHSWTILIVFFYVVDCNRVVDTLIGGNK